MSRENEEEEQPRARPRVVDKRVSSRPEGSPTPVADPAPPPAPAPAEAPALEIPQEPAGGAGLAAGEVWTPEAEAEARRIVEELVSVPSSDWVVNAAATLANAGGAKLEAGLFDDAALAIDSLAALLQASAGRIGPAEPTLRQVLSQLQLAFAGRSMPTPPPVP